MVLPQKFNTERCSLSIFNKHDARALHEVVEKNYEHLRVFMNHMDREPLTLKERFIYVERCWDNFLDDKICQYAIRHNGELIGSFGVELGESSVALNYWIVKNQTNRGFITEVVAEAIKLIFNSGICKICIACDERNIYSRKVAEKFGFKLIETREHVDFNNPRQPFQLMIWEKEKEE